MASPLGLSQRHLKSSSFHIQHNNSLKKEITDMEDYDDDGEHEKGGRKSKSKFSNAAVKTLVAKVREHKDILLTKDCSSDLLGTRRQIWMQITECVNLVDKVRRDVNEVKKRWADLRRHALRRKNMRRDGIKNNTTVKKAIDVEVLQIVKETESNYLSSEDETKTVVIDISGLPGVHYGIKQSDGTIKVMEFVKGNVDNSDPLSGSGANIVASPPDTMPPDDNNPIININSDDICIHTDDAVTPPGIEADLESRKRKRSNLEDHFDEYDEHMDKVPPDPFDNENLQESAVRPDDVGMINMNSQHAVESVDQERLRIEKERLAVENKRLTVEEKRLQIEERRLQIEERRLEVEEQRVMLMKQQVTGAGLQIIEIDDDVQNVL